MLLSGRSEVAAVDIAEADDFDTTVRTQRGEVATAHAAHTNACQPQPVVGGRSQSSGSDGQPRGGSHASALKQETASDRCIQAGHRVFSLCELVATVPGQRVASKTPLSATPTRRCHPAT
jgi:Mg-chelatase subunit ChlI